MFKGYTRNLEQGNRVRYIALPPRNFVPRDLVDEKESEEEEDEFKLCKDCVTPSTCKDFNRCIGEDYM